MPEPDEGGIPGGGGDIGGPPLPPPPSGGGTTPSVDIPDPFGDGETDFSPQNSLPWISWFSGAGTPPGDHLAEWYAWWTGAGPQPITGDPSAWFDWFKYSGGPPEGDVVAWYNWLATGGVGPMPGGGSSGGSSGGGGGSVNPMVGQFSSIYFGLWGQMPPPGYVEQFVGSMNVFEFMEHERQKPAFVGTPTFKQESQPLIDAIQLIQRLAG